MNIPSYMNIICNLSGDILQNSAEINIKSIFEIIDPLSLSKFKEEIKNIIDNKSFLEIRKTYLIDHQLYYVSFEIVEGTKLRFRFKKDCDNTCGADCFWRGSVAKYDYYINRARHIIHSTSNLVKNVFYKNRSNVSEILIELSQSLNFKYSMVLFRNGCDHAIYCKDSLNGYESIILDELPVRFEDPVFDINVQDRISATFITKYYCNTYMKLYCDEKNISDNSIVYILKLMLGPKQIGYFEFITHKNINLTPTELNLIESLSTILAYTINNKAEQIEIEKYIKEKLILPTNS
jgi:hypothetical protein